MSIQFRMGVEASRRSGDGRDLFILINFAKEPRTVSLPRTMKILLSGGEGGTLDLPPYAVEILADAK